MEICSCSGSNYRILHRADDSSVSVYGKRKEEGQKDSSGLAGRKRRGIRKGGAHPSPSPVRIASYNTKDGAA